MEQLCQRISLGDVIFLGGATGKELEDEVRDLNTRAVILAKEAREAGAEDRRVYIHVHIFQARRGAFGGVHDSQLPRAGPLAG